MFKTLFAAEMFSQVKLIFIFSFLISLLTSAQTYAQDTELFHQPDAAHFELTPHVGFRTATVLDASPGAKESNFNGIDRLGFQASYGLSRDYAFGFDFAYSKFRAAQGPDLRGFEPLTVFASGRTDTSIGQFDYALKFIIGLERASIGDPINRSYGDPLSDLPAGGFQIVPVLGYTHAAGPGVLGVRIEQAVVKSDVKADSAAGDVTLKGGVHGSAEIFFEVPAADTRLGAAATLDWFNFATAEASPGPIAGAAMENHTLIGAQLYAVMPIDDWQFLPAIAWREKAAGAAYERMGDIQFQIAARWSL